jgi:hypothetical protein
MHAYVPPIPPIAGLLGSALQAPCTTCTTCTVTASLLMAADSTGDTARGSTVPEFVALRGKCCHLLPLLVPGGWCCCAHMPEGGSAVLRGSLLVVLLLPQLPLSGLHSKHTTLLRSARHSTILYCSVSVCHPSLSSCPLAHRCVAA